MDPEERGLRVSAFGELRVHVDGQPVTVRGRQRRTVLASLLLHSPQPVPVERLLARLNGAGAAPDARDPANAVHAHVRRLRELVEPGVPARSAQRIRSTPNGYALVPDWFDLWEYQTAIDAAERSSSEDPEAALRDYRHALELWDEPWRDFRSDEHVARAVAMLEERHRANEELAADLALSLGLGAAVADDLVSLARAEPGREHRWAAAMRALFQANRQAEALRLFDEARRWLGEELGLEPGPELIEMERSVLRHDVALLGRPRRPSGPALPLTTFVGRRDELTHLDHLVQRHRVVTVTGLGGVGKSRLVLHWRRRSDHGAAEWIDLRGVVSERDALQRVLSDLGLGISDDDVDPVDVVAATMPSGSSLLILDNAEAAAVSADLVARLTAAIPHLRVVVTSRLPLGLTGEATLMLSPLALPLEGQEVAGTAVELVMDRLGIGADETLARALATRYGGLPLPLELIAARHAQDPTPTEELVDDVVIVTRERLSASGAVVDAVDVALEHLSPQATALLWTSLQFPGGATAELLGAAHAPGGRPIDRLERARLLRELVRASLLTTAVDRGGVRYQGLAPVAQIAGVRIDAAERSRALVRAARWWSVRSRSSFFEPPSRTGLIDLDADGHNIAHVLRALEDADAAAMLSLASHLFDHWDRTGRTAEGRRWIRDGLERVRPTGGELVLANAALIAGSGGLGGNAEHLPLAEASRAAMVDAGEQHGDLWAVTHVQLAIGKGWNGDLAGSLEALAIARAEAERHGSEWFMATVDRFATLGHALAGQPAEGQRLAIDVAGRFEAMDDPASAAGSLYFASVLGRMAGDDDLEEILLRARALAESARSVSLRALIAGERGQDARRRGAPDAPLLLGTAAALTERAGNLRTGSVTRRDLGILLLHSGRHRAAASELVRSARHLIRLDERSAALALAGLSAIVRDDRVLADALAASAWQLADVGFGTPISREDVAAIEGLIGPRPQQRHDRQQRLTPAGTPTELIDAAEAASCT